MKKQIKYFKQDISEKMVKSKKYIQMMKHKKY